MADDPKSTVPVPDPTLLTTAQLDRAVSYLEAKFGARLDAMDKAQELLHEDFVRVPTEMDKQASHLKDVIESELRGFVAVSDEKFASVDRQFSERDTRTEQAAIATKIAVDAALQAQKEAAGAQNESNAAAITKSEAATVKQIDGIMALLNSNVTATNDKIADLKGRLDRGEGTGNSLYSMAAAMAAMLALLISAFAAYHSGSLTPPIQPTVQYVPAPTAVPAPVTVPR
jgi:hypothetical protein